MLISVDLTIRTGSLGSFLPADRIHRASNIRKMSLETRTEPDDRRIVIDHHRSDELWMEEALRCAQRALEDGEVPVGAVVVCEGKIVGADGTATSLTLTHGSCRNRCPARSRCNRW